MLLEYSDFSESDCLEILNMTFFKPTIGLLQTITFLKLEHSSLPLYIKTSIFVKSFAKRPVSTVLSIIFHYFFYYWDAYYHLSYYICTL